jgi:hypothetical protein
LAVTVSTEWKFRDLQTIIIENEKLYVAILPELGAKLWKITYRPKDKELLWQHPRLKLRKLPFHSTYDDTFFGGWDELYPNDAPEEINGEKYPDHGEIWTMQWEYHIEKMTEEEVTIHLWVETAISSSKVEKWITLKTGESKLHFKHKITNTGQIDQPFLWKLHAAVSISENSRIDMGAKTVYVEDFGPSRLNQTEVYYQWPFAKDPNGNEVDMRKVLPPESKVNEFQYGVEMVEGWCAVTDTEDRIGFGLLFDLNVLPSCWLFASYGGWRNLNTVVLEPCTGYPVSVTQGIDQGTHKILKPNETIECDITAVVYEGFECVNRIDFEGNVY